MVVFASSIIPSFSVATPSNIAPIAVWFDGNPQSTILYPTFYGFNVAAQTSPGLWITILHWDFGDGSTLNSVYSAQSYVSEIRYHQYAQAGVYTVTVTAYDNIGDSATAQITVFWPF